MKAIDFVIPVYNESVDVVRSTIEKVKKALSGIANLNIIVVDDGSKEGHGLESLQNEEGIVFIRHEANIGYGAALKTGILAGSASWIAITDADGTYPVEEMPSLLKLMERSDMAVGVRTGPVREIPWARRLPKRGLNNMASYLTSVRIEDLNSGMRIFTRDLCNYLWGLFPSRFSFTSTLTMGAVMSGFRVTEHPINYYKRVGKSSMHPIKDTFRFFRTALRLGLLFFPMKIFGPIGGMLLTLGTAKGVIRDFLILGYIGNLAVILMVAGIQILMLGLIGEMIVHSRNLKLREPNR